MFMFSGQGSQFFQMGRELYESDSVFRQTMIHMDEIVGDMIGRSVVKEIYDPGKGKGDLFDDLALSHPAIFMIESALVRALSARGVVPDSIVGASLGEFVAAALYGIVNFETAFRGILSQPIVYGDSLEKGGMIAILASPDFFYQTPVLHDNSEIAGVNFDNHFVVSATADALETIRGYLDKTGIDHFVLPVSYAFHSSHLDRIRDPFTNLYRGLDFHCPEVAFNSCADAREIKHIDQDYFWRVIRNPIRFGETIIRMASERPCIFVDVGPSGTLATFAKYNLSGNGRSETWPILTPFGHERENFNRILKRCYMLKPKRTATPITKPAVEPSGMMSGKDLGSQTFKKRFNLAYACLAGGMFRGISSARLVVQMGNAGMMGFFGTQGLPLEKVDENIAIIRRGLDKGREFGVNLSAGPDQAALVSLILERDITCIEVSGFIDVPPELVKYRAAGMGKDPNHPDRPCNRIIAKLSRPEVAEHFLSSPRERILDQLVNSGEISASQASMARKFPVADALCVTAGCGGHTDRGTSVTLLPVMIGLRNRVQKETNCEVFVGAAGGIGTPEAAAAAFVLGADFILTGSINQCTVEAGTSEAVKTMLQDINVQDTEYAPAGDIFEMGARVQVLRRGVFFPARANKLYQLYSRFDSLEEIPEKTARQIQDRYFKRSFEDIWNEHRTYLKSQGMEAVIEKVEANPKQKMAAVFRWYFQWSTNLALAGDQDNSVDFQVYTGPALGAFNQWVKGTDLESWQNRHVDRIAQKLLDETEALLRERMKSFLE